MEGMQSISTSCLCNKLCEIRKSNEKTICNKCFADSQLKYHTNNQPIFEYNTKVLTESVIPEMYLPTINACYFRFESFGDLNNSNQVKNYFNICKKNPDTNFAIWTKNPWFIAEAIKDGYEKPSNLNIIFSSLFLNQVNEAVAKYYSFIDKVFTVYDKEHAENVEINCGSRKCMDCKRCYKKHVGEIEYINELLK